MKFEKTSATNYSYAAGKKKPEQSIIHTQQEKKNLNNQLFIRSRKKKT
jgi:hypothetical protein